MKKNIMLICVSGMLISACSSDDQNANEEIIQPDVSIEQNVEIEEEAEEEEDIEGINALIVIAKQVTTKIPSESEKAPNDYEGPEAGQWLQQGVMDNVFYNISVSSELKAQGKSSYSVDNLSDDNPQTAWVEGKDDYGIGEYIEFSDFYGSTLVIYNGYQKNTDSYQNNSRVKQFEVFVDNASVGFINLHDSPGEQTIDFNKFNVDFQEKKIRLIIAEVYEGKKWKDTAISQMFYRGG